MGTLERKRIFVVEDNIQNRVVYHMMFLRHNATVQFDRWGNDTLNKLINQPAVDVIIMDLMLTAGISGFDVFDLIRRHHEFDTVPIVAVSAADPGVAIPRCQEKGFSGFIAKPIDNDHFPELISRIIAGEAIWLASSVEV